jgi:hypothetical protein
MNTYHADLQGLDGDKEPEVIFASWTSFDKKTNPSG